MSEDFGSDFITIVDDDGTEFELEVLDTMDYNGETYKAFLPADMDENDPDYGMIILRSVLDESGEEIFESIDDEAQLQDVYEHFMVLLFDDEDESESETGKRNNPHPRYFPARYGIEYTIPRTGTCTEKRFLLCSCCPITDFTAH